MSAIGYGIMGGLQIWNGLQEAEMIRRQTAMTQGIMDMNAKYSEIDAWYAELQGYSDVARYEATIDAINSDQKVFYAARDVDSSFGSAAEVMRESQMIGFLNGLDIEKQARNRAYGFKVEASNFRLGSFMQGIQGSINARAAVTKGFLQAGTTAIQAYGEFSGANAGPTGYRQSVPNTQGGYSGVGNYATP